MVVRFRKKYSCKWLLVCGADLGRESETRVWVNVNDTIMFSATFTTIPLKFLIPHFTVNHTVKFHRESHTAVVK